VSPDGKSLSSPVRRVGGERRPGARAHFFVELAATPCSRLCDREGATPLRPARQSHPHAEIGPTKSRQGATLPAHVEPTGHRHGRRGRTGHQLLRTGLSRQCDPDPEQQPECCDSLEDHQERRGLISPLIPAVCGHHRLSFVQLVWACRTRRSDTDPVAGSERLSQIADTRGVMPVRPVADGRVLR
jgi:hypothetical protein